MGHFINNFKKFKIQPIHTVLSLKRKQHYVSNNCLNRQPQRTRMDSLSIVEEEDETDINGHAGLRSQLERERERFFFHNGS